MSFFEGSEKAEPAPGVTEAIMEAERIIICPSNPILSIAPILSIPAIRRALKHHHMELPNSTAAF